MKRHTTVFFTALLIHFSACDYNNEEQLYPTSSCETVDMSYAIDVTDILQNYSCISCHSSANSQHSVILEGYDNVKVWVDSGTLLKSMKHDGASPMPKNQTKMNPCDIDKIEAWITAGALNN
jgi:mono/diheme cytochrome c family protein